MPKKYNRNEVTLSDPRYTQQQNAIKEVCKNLNLVPYYPNYHATKEDTNTVIIYTKEGHEYNEKNLSDDASVDDEKGRVCCLENTDINGLFDLNFMNRGKIDMRGVNPHEKIEGFIKSCLKTE